MKVELVAVVCTNGHVTKAPKGCVWPVGCSKCEYDAAPKAWWKLNDGAKP